MRPAGTALVIATIGLCAMAVSACSSSKSPAPTPSSSRTAVPSPSAEPLALTNPCVLLSAADVSAVIGKSVEPGVLTSAATGLYSSPGGECHFALPTPPPLGSPIGPVHTGQVVIATMSVAEFDNTAKALSGPTLGVRPISLEGADAAFEVVGPDKDVVFAKRAGVPFSVNVIIDNAADVTSEKTIARQILSRISSSS